MFQLSRKDFIPIGRMLFVPRKVVVSRKYLACSKERLCSCVMAICSKESLQLFLGTTLFLRNIVFVPRKNFVNRKYFACSMKRLCLWVMASKESRQLFLRKTLFLGKILFVHRKTFFLGHFLFVSKKITANIFLFPGKHLFKIVQNCSNIVQKLFLKN